MSDLYREPTAFGQHDHLTDGHGNCEYCGATVTWVVKVKPCIHRNYAGHIIGGQGGQHPWIATTATGEPHWCDGTPEEDTHTPFEQSIIDAVESGTLSDRDGLHILGYEGDG